VNREVRCPRCGFEADKEMIGKPNVMKRSLKIPGISEEL
jgi:DNA-directed RNA polymerase subunit RPC12/RpoP